MINIDINEHDSPLFYEIIRQFADGVCFISYHYHAWLHDYAQLNHAFYETVAENNFGSNSRLKLMNFSFH